MFSALIKALNEYPIILLMRSRLLINQAFETLCKLGIGNVGLVHGDECNVDHITLATAQSLHKIPESHMKKVRVLIIDEVHEWGTNKAAVILRKFSKTYFRLGFSATPWRKESKIHNYRIKSWIGPELIDTDMEYLQNEGILSKCNVHFHDIHLIGMKQNSFIDAEQEGIVSNLDYNRSIAELVESIPSGRILIMVKRIEQGDLLHYLIPSSYWIKGADTIETREYVINLLRARENGPNKVIGIVSSIGYLGINVHVHHLINASGGKSSLQLIQKYGRGLRTASDKEYLEYHDFNFIGNPYLENHSKLRLSYLKNLSQIEE